MSKAKPTLLGFPIGCESIDSSLEAARSALSTEGKQTVFACANTHSLVVTDTDAKFREALHNADILVADGVGVTVAAKLFGQNVGRRIAGEQFFASVMQDFSARGGVRVFFLGSSENVLEKMKSRLGVEYPGIELAGAISPPYREMTAEENEDIVNAINASNTDVLWVGMTAPKQEKWVYENRSELNVRLIGSIGAVFDFFAQTRPSPPSLIRKLGLEWLYLLVKNPGRTWKRVFISTPKYLILLYRYHLGRTKRNHVQR